MSPANMSTFRLTKVLSGIVWVLFRTPLVNLKKPISDPVTNSCYDSYLLTQQNHQNVYDMTLSPL